MKQSPADSGWYNKGYTMPPILASQQKKGNEERGGGAPTKCQRRFRHYIRSATGYNDYSTSVVNRLYAYVLLLLLMVSHSVGN